MMISRVEASAGSALIAWQASDRPCPASAFEHGERERRPCSRRRAARERFAPPSTGVACHPQATSCGEGSRGWSRCRRRSARARPAGRCRTGRAPRRRGCLPNRAVNQKVDARRRARCRRRSRRPSARRGAARSPGPGRCRRTARRRAVGLREGLEQPRLLPRGAMPMPVSRTANAARSDVAVVALGRASRARRPRRAR